MHPTVFHADADHRHQDDRTKAAATVKSFLSGLSRTLAPAPRLLDLESHAGRPLSIYGPR